MPELWWSCTGVVMELYRSCDGVIPKFTGVIPELYQSCTREKFIRGDKS